LLWLLFASALGGYWLVWDQRAQYTAQMTATLFDALPIVVEPMAFGFLSDAVVSDRFFSLLIFLHIGIPLALLMGMFIHIQRISQSRSFPPKTMAWTVIIALTLLSIVKPALSVPPASLDQPIHQVQLDWFYMNFFPIIEAAGPAMTWLLLLGVTVTLLIIPNFVPKDSPPVAVVDPNFCNGCGWCFTDCPYDAIYMKDHDFRPGHHQSVVITDKCVGCGICAGACPTATPFKSVNKAFSGINLDDELNSAILERTIKAVQQMDSEKRILLASCDHGPEISQLAAADVTTLQLPCIGQLPPSYLDYLCRRESVDSVLLTGCSTGNCFHRLGNDLQDARLAHEREPHLRYKDVQAKVSTVWAGPHGIDDIRKELDRLRGEETRVA
ncbi:MAG: 4Fe-4S binding protein, partial [Gammaproteobacteria bacterium]|nr:4Fe-4S binding protein [Gammaproteobacteria bacterium]